MGFPDRQFGGYRPRALTEASAPIGEIEARPSPKSALKSQHDTPLPFSLVVGMFVLSGSAGLIDQLCFSKYLGYIVGSTAYAVSAVLAAFMAGLALGAHFGGRLSPRVARPLFAYGLLELLVAGFVALTPIAFSSLTPLYKILVGWAPNSFALISVVRWLLAMLVVIVPTMAMGATLPLLSRALGQRGARATSIDDRARQRRLGALYAANTLGGALGALGAAYFIVPALGLSNTLFLAAAISALVGASGLVLGRALRVGLVVDAPAVSGERPRLDHAPVRRELTLLTVLAFWSGALVFTAEVIFTHLLALIIGNSVYAFGLILAIFLCCLFFGATAATRAQQRFGDWALPLSLAASALALAVTLPLWDELPILFSGSGEIFTTFEARELFRGLVAFGILLLPTTLMGLTFPLLLQRIARYQTVGALVGRLTAVNTLGAVVGALVAGYLLLPHLGSESSLTGVVLCFAALAGYTSWVLATPAHVPLGLAAAAALFGLLGPRWDLARLTEGSNVYFRGAEEPDRILMMREDAHGGVTTVTETNGVRTLYTNGKFQGNTGWEMNAQRYFAHYPCLFIDNFDHALVIGLGTGTTTGTLTRYPWQRIDVVEISPDIERAARNYFADANHHALEDPRVHLHLDDGRNYLLLDDQHYDLISMELSSIWFAGASSLYSREFYQLVRARLKPDGRFQQWVQLHHVLPVDFATILQTLRAEFEHVALFYGGGQGILTASRKPLKASLAKIAAHERDPGIHPTLPQVMLADGSVELRRLPDLLGDMLVMDADLDAFLLAVARENDRPLDSLVSTDDNLYLEYATPRGNVLPWETRERLVDRILGFRREQTLRALYEP